MATSGDIREARCSHPDLGDFVFYPKSNEGNTLDQGGYRTADDANMIDGSGEPIWQLNLQRGFFEIVCADDMNIAENSTNACKLAASPKAGNWIVSMSNGTTWGATAKPVGDIQTDTNASTFTMKISGGVFTKIGG